MDASGQALFGPHGCVADRVRLAGTPWRRLRGLLGRRRLEPAEALILSPCSQVHTVGLRFPIDAVFCDRDLLVLHVATLRPFRLSPRVLGAWCCIELAAGRAQESGVERGARLEIRPPERAP